MSVRTMVILDPHEAVMITTFVMQPQGDRDSPATGARLWRENIGYVEPLSDVRPATKLINWNYHGAGKRGFAIYFLGLKHAHNPHVIVLMEMRLSECRAYHIIHTLGFEAFYRVPAVGFTSGIWVLWDPLVVHVEIIDSFNQSIHMLTSFNNTQEWVFLPIYANPNPASIPELPWLVARDMNDMASPSEKWGGGKFIHHRATIFNKRVNDCRLMDLGFKGPSYTWLGKRHGGLIIRESLDYALASRNGVFISWKLQFFTFQAFSSTTGSSPEKRKLHLVSWKQVKKAKANEGLNIREAHQANTAHLATRAASLLEPSDQLWAIVVKGKYLKQESLFDHLRRTHHLPF
ncbi:hypothetical protein LguiA_014604 [Lonicera macranthoides]